MRASGSAKALSERSGVPFGTLQRYLSGGELKLSNALALARATGVRLEWLAAGEGPMSDGDLQAPPDSLPPPIPPPRAQDVLDLDDLVVAYQAALAAFAARGAMTPEPRKLLALALALYDAARETLDAEETSRGA